MTLNRQVNIEIDKLTRSIENAISGDSFKTEVLHLSAKDLKSFKKTAWLFDWKAETKIKANQFISWLLLRILVSFKAL